MWFFSTEINYFEYHGLCLCEERRRYFSKIAEGFCPVFLRKAIVRIHQHLRTAWKKIDNYRLHYAFKQASKILNHPFKTTAVCKCRDKFCEEHQFSDQSTLATKTRITFLEAQWIFSHQTEDFNKAEMEFHVWNLPNHQMQPNSRLDIKLRSYIKLRHKDKWRSETRLHKTAINPKIGFQTM